MFQDFIVLSIVAVFFYALGRFILETMVAEWGLIPTILFWAISGFIGYIQYRIDNY